MANNLILTAIIGGDKEPNKINVFTVNSGPLLATVYCDQQIEFNKYGIQLHELTQIKTIAENFNLFFANIVKG